MILMDLSISVNGGGFGSLDTSSRAVVQRRASTRATIPNLGVWNHVTFSHCVGSLFKFTTQQNATMNKGSAAKRIQVR